jgi:hypothetical protein
MQRSIVQCTTPKKELPMIAAIERFLDAIFAPLARELARLPASAVRGLFMSF